MSNIEYNYKLQKKILVAQIGAEMIYFILLLLSVHSNLVVFFEAICHYCFQFHYKTIEWHPDVATQMLIGNEDDRYPVIQVKKQLNPISTIMHFM